MMDAYDRFQTELAINVRIRSIAEILDDDWQCMRVELQNHQVGPGNVAIPVQHRWKLMGEGAVHEPLLLVAQVAAGPAVATSRFSLLPSLEFHDVKDRLI